MKKLRTYTLCLLVTIATSCSMGAEIGYQPSFVPIRVSVNSRGHINLSVSRGIATPIGTFDINSSQTVYSLRQSEARVLIVRVDNKATVYELVEEEDFRIEFDDDGTLYRKVSLDYQADGDITLELESIQIANTPNPIGYGTSVPNQNTIPPANITCSGAPPTRLNVGMRARVTYTDGTSGSVRPATASGQILGKVPEGAGMDVIGGPRCDNSRVWWRVKTDNGYTGWISEGKPGEYWLEPTN